MGQSGTHGGIGHLGLNLVHGWVWTGQMLFRVLSSELELLMLADHFSLPFLCDTNMWLQRQLVLFAQIQLMKRSRIVKFSQSHSLKKATCIVECISKFACCVWKIIGTTLAIPKNFLKTTWCEVDSY